MTPNELTQRIETAEAGATLHLPQGRFEGLWVLKRPITLVGAGAGRTIMDAGGRGAVFVVEAAEGGVRLDGMTLTGGRSRAGGGLATHHGATVTLSRCCLQANQAANGRGGGVNIQRGAVHLLGCELNGNSASEGGAIFVGEDAEARIEGCWLAQNSAERGGALAFGDGARVHIADTRLEENEAVRKAHHMYTFGDATRRPYIHLCRVIFGEVSAEGPRIVNDSDFEAQIELDHTEWPSDSSDTSAKAQRRRFTLH